MPIFLLFATLSPQGTQTLKATPERLLEVNREIEAAGAKVRRQWALLGFYDFLSVVEAPDQRTLAKVTIELASRGSARFDTFPALSIDEFLADLAGD